MTGRLVALGVLLSVVVGCGTPTATIDAGTNELAPVGVAGGATVLTADDRAEIRDLAGRYSHALDLGDVSAWSEVFTVDGGMEMEAQGYNITGDALWSLPSGNVDRSAPQSRHMPTTFVIAISAGDHIVASIPVDYIVIITTPNFIIAIRANDNGIGGTTTGIKTACQAECLRIKFDNFHRIRNLIKDRNRVLFYSGRCRQARGCST